MEHEATPSTVAPAPGDASTLAVAGSTSGAPRPARREAAAAVWRWREAAPADTAEGGQEVAKLRRQGLIQALVGVAAGTLIFLFWHRNLAFLVWGIAAVTLAAALVSPQGAYAAIGRGLAWFSRWVGRILGYVLLVPLFMLFFTVFGRLARGGRRDRLQRFFDRQAATYWRRREDTSDLEHFQRQF